MSQHVANTAQQVFSTATIAGGSASYIATHSSEITVIAVVITGVFSIIFGLWNARIQSKRNDINKRNITEDILATLHKDMTTEEMNKIRDSLRK